RSNATFAAAASASGKAVALADAPDEFPALNARSSADALAVFTNEDCWDQTEILAPPNPASRTPATIPHLIFLAISGSSNKCLRRTQIFRLDRQAPHAFAGSGKNRIGHRWSNRRHSRLSHTSGMLRARNDINFNYRRLKHAHHRIVVEIPLLHAPFIQSDFRFQRRGKTKND